jgi:hypothetical protein
MEYLIVGFIVGIALYRIYKHLHKPTCGDCDRVGNCSKHPKEQTINFYKKNDIQ